VKILFLGANALDTSRLRIDGEFREIQAELERVRANHTIEVRTERAVTPVDLSRLLLDYEPDVVHFSAHGALVRVAPNSTAYSSREMDEPDSSVATESAPQSSIFLETRDGKSSPVSSKALARLFSVLKQQRCVVLNACFSAPQADEIAAHVDCVIGMQRAINDMSAIAFAVGFYQAIARGRTIKTAFDLGCSSIATHNLPDADVPTLHARRADPATVRLVPPRVQTSIPPTLPTPVPISDLEVGPIPEEEARRLARAIAPRAEDEPVPDSVLRFLRSSPEDASDLRFTFRELRPHPSLLARYHPPAARPLLPGYDGFAFHEFAKAYRKKVADRCQDHRLLGLPPTQMRRDDLQSRISLSKLFVPLRLRPDKDGARPASLTSLLAARKNVVVLGDPGMGKSTLLGFLALLFAGGAKLDGFTPSLPTIPMLISLRDFAHEQKRQPNGLRFIDYLALRASTDHQLLRSHWSFFDAMLRMGEAIVLFDGLDEVGGDAARLNISRKILDFRDEYPHVPIWVTSRVYGYTSNIALPEGRFEHFRILDLDDTQVGDFLYRWYNLQYPESPRERDDLRESLHAAVFRTPRVRRLAGCPLLLTLMAFIHRVVRSLPQDRAELYDQCIEMLLNTWQEAKKGQNGEIERHKFDELNLHRTTQKDYLAHLALFIQEKNQGEDSDEARGIIDRADALECLAERHYDIAVRSRTHLRRAEAREEMSHFLDYIGDRTGLLLDRGGGKLSFIHLSFQEYLAAWLFALDPSAHDNPAFFKQHLGKQVWEEVLLLRLYVILRMQGGGGEKAFDAVTNAVFRELERADIAEGWLTLVRALRDNLDFTAAQQEAILSAAISAWSASITLTRASRRVIGIPLQLEREEPVGDGRRHDREAAVLDGLANARDPLGVDGGLGRHRFGKLRRAGLDRFLLAAHSLRSRCRCGGIDRHGPKARRRRSLYADGVHHCLSPVACLHRVERPRFRKF